MIFKTFIVNYQTQIVLCPLSAMMANALRTYPKQLGIFTSEATKPAQKWLKDRKERALEMKDILHYQKIIVALAQTNDYMGMISNWTKIINKIIRHFSI